MKAKKTNGHETFKVESGIPLPERAGTRSGLSAALDAMKVGDSFLAPKGAYGSVRTLASIRKYRMATRTEGEGFMRVWRVA